MASEMVERLAQIWAEETYANSSPLADGEDRQDARWWLNAIADELEQANEIWSDQVVQDDMARWLRAQAGEEDYNIE